MFTILYHRRMEFTFHTSYVILELVPSTVIFFGQSSVTDTNSTQQCYVAPRLKSSLHRLYCRHHNLVDRYEISISQIRVITKLPNSEQPYKGKVKTQMTVDLLFLRRCLLSSITAKTFTRLYYI
jgi:hypothetical protein